MEDLRKWIREKFQVKILAMSSYETSMVLNNYGLTPEDLLNPFSEITHSFSIKSLTKTLTIPSFKVKVFEKIELKRNDQIFNNIGPQVNWQEKWVFGEESVEKILTNPTPWYYTWAEDYFKSQLFSQHELIDMPLCIIYLASTNDKDPLQTFQTLARTQGLPPMYQSKIYDSKVPKVYILLHDPSKTQISSQSLLALQEKLQKGLAPSLFYLQMINSSNNSQSLLWEKTPNFSQEESLKLHVMMSEILIRAIVPFSESALKTLDLILEQKKRGLKNSISKFFTKKERPETFAFQVDCIEHVCRLLADIAFLFGDYEEALNHYKSVSHDLKALKAWSHAASVHEMMALCSLMLNQDLKEAESLLDLAYGFYQKSGDQSLMTRCLLFHRHLFFKQEFAKKLAVKLLSGCTDVKDIKYVVPLFTEQAALCYLSFNPSYYRKYAFYLVIAGDEFRKLELVQYALNCYYSASHAYSGKKWEYIEMHIQHMLGRFCYFLNMQIESVYFYLNLVSSPKLLQHRDQHQKKIINELMATVAQWVAMPIPADFNQITQEKIRFHSDGRPILDFSLPKITKYEISLPQDRVSSVFYSKSSDFVLWKTLLPKDYSVFSEHFKGFDGETAKNLTKGLYAGEEIQISIHCLNTMSFPTVFEQLCVIIEHEDGSLATTSPIESLELTANEEKKIVFVCPQLNPGKVKILDLQWSFGKVFYGNFKFKPEEFLVYSPVSAVVLEFSDFPEYLLDGEYRQLKIFLKNQELNFIEDLSLNFSHSYLFGKKNLFIGKLEPGEVREINLPIRGEKIGTHLVRFLATYTSSEQKRFSRFQSSLEIKPSLKIMTRLDYSLKNIEENILSIVIKPAIDSRLDVKQIIPLSPYSLRLIKNIANEVYYVAIQPGQNSSICFNNCEDINKRFVQDVKAVINLDENSGLDLIIYWELEYDRLVSGYHYLFIQNIKDQSSPVCVTLSAPTNLKHDFCSSLLCQVPVKLSVKNVSNHSFESISLTAVQDEEFKDFTWVGSTTKKVLSFASGQTAHLELLASFYRAGCFDLNRFVVRINDVIAEIPRPLQQILIS